MSTINSSLLTMPTTVGTTPTTSTSSSTSSSGTNSTGMNLSPMDFVNMMVTQLQNQDPLSPTSDTDLLSQMSEIGQLQSSTQLQSSLSTMVMQNQIASAGNMIGKYVQGLDANGNQQKGIVNSVAVKSDGIYLQLDNNSELSMSNVQSITTPPTTGTTAAAASTAATTNAANSGAAATPAA